MDLSASISKTAPGSTSSSPGLFHPSVAPISRQQTGASLSDGTPHSSPFLHPLQMHRVRETHIAQVDKDFITGRKLINQYEIIDEIGRGVHGKVKLARSLETQDYVAIKIIQRFSKKRRLGRVTVSPEDKTKREIAILKKIRHPNVVGLLEVIDDPELKKIYMVLEHVELGEIVWRKKGSPAICLHERRRIEKEIAGEHDTGDEEKFFKMMQRRRQRKEAQRSKLTQLQLQHGPAEYWSLEHGDDDEEEIDMPTLSRQNTHESLPNFSRSHTQMVRSNPSSRVASRAPSRAGSRAHTPLPTEFEIGALDSDNEDDAPGPLRSLPSTHGSATALEGTMYGSYPDDPPFRGRSPSMADSIISHMSSVDDMISHDAFEDDFSYVPCFTLEQARTTFRDTVLGLEYLHYEGIVHRDIKPANLLWTKDHRVKISDFGVSYFGRPIREGETEENVSEADATDFDDDLELAKTVGTPAFFAPELCYTDLDIEQPKVTEQIDVWSLGITLYCLIYARIPFMAEDEYGLFRTIAKEDVYIPRRRLKPIDPAFHNNSHLSLHKRMGPPAGQYREDGELVYEEIDDELCDLLKRMLVKDPTERMKLREVKRHPWVVKGIENIIGWLDDSDPSRKTAGRRIQVDNSELERAVVPITFLERARSAIKKTVGKAISAVRSERGEGSRRRAVSSATGSVPDMHSILSPHARENTRRASLRGDEFDYFETIKDEHRYDKPEHPLAQSLTASPDYSVNSGEDPFSLDFKQKESASVGGPQRRGCSGSSNPDSRPELQDRTLSATSAATSVQTVVHRGHGYTRSITNASVGRHFPDHDIRAGPFTDHAGNIFGGHLWMPKVPDIHEDERVRTAERGLFGSDDKHGEASVAVSKGVAPGQFEPPSILRHPRPSRSVDLSPVQSKPLASPLFFQPYMVSQHLSSASTPNVTGHAYATSLLDDRPATANRTPEAQTPAPRVYGASTPESFQRAQETLDRRCRIQEDDDRKRREFTNAVRAEAEADRCPSSPDDDLFMRREAQKRAQSSSSISSANLGMSALTSPSDMTSPVSSVNNMGSPEQFFASVPSLPALVSGASSDKEDPEGDFLQRPGVVRAPESVLSVESSPDTMTPPILSKEPSISTDDDISTGSIQISQITEPFDEDVGYNGDGDTTCAAEEDDDSDSDEGLTMTARKRKPLPVPKAPTGRRGTNASVGSTETAKKVIMTE